MAKLIQDRFGQKFAPGDTICFMRSSGNYLEIGLILSISDAGNAKIVESDGSKSTFLLTRKHRVVKTVDPIHQQKLKEVYKRVLGKDRIIAEAKGEDKPTDLSFLELDL